MDNWPEPAEGGTTIGSEQQPFESPLVDGSKGADFDFGRMAQWAIFAAGALTSSIIWFIIFLAAKLLP